MIGSENVVETLSVLTCPYATKFHTSCTYILVQGGIV